MPVKSHYKKGRTRAVVSVSITPEKTEEFYAALATLKRHHEDPFIQAAPLIVETIIEAARRIQQEAVKEKIPGGKGAKRPYSTVHLSRFACYLLVENADPEGRPIVAMGQKYFAVQTRRQELADELTLSALPEDQKRLIYRREMAVLNHQLAETAKLSGVIKPEHFATFTDRGYQGLYNGETENMIHTRKELQEGEHILDFMGSDELIANAFRASLARQRLERDKTRDREQANQVHYQAGRKVRQTIEEFGGTVPEQLPTPKKSFGQLEREEQQRIEQSKQPPLFPEDA